VSNKSSLKDRIKKTNATQEFFNSYETDNVKSSGNDTNEAKIDDHDDKNIDIKDNIYDINNNDDNDINDTDNNKNNKIIIEDESNSNHVVINKNDDDYLRELALGKKPKNKKSKKVFTSFYMDPDLAIEVDKIAARGEKGDKSKLINMGIRKLLEDYGVIEAK
jgi:hypothetical protein